MYNMSDSYNTIWTASSEFGTYRLCEQRRFRRACASAQSRQNLRCSLIQALNQEELSDRKPDPWPLWMAGHAQLKLVMTECSKTQIRLTGPILCRLTKLFMGRFLWVSKKEQSTYRASFPTSLTSITLTVAASALMLGNSKLAKKLKKNKAE